MSGRFEGISDSQWDIIGSLLPGPSRRVGRPNPDLRKVLNTILYVEITGCRWCDVPVGEQWAKRSTAHQWLGHLEKSGTWERRDIYWNGFLQISLIMIWVDKLV